MPLKVVMVPRRFTRESWGGIETAVVETSRRLLAMGHDVKVFCPAALAAAGDDVVDGVPVRRFPHFYPYLGLDDAARDRMDRKAGNLFSFSLLAGLLREPGIDLIHLHTGKRLGGIVRQVSRLRRIPYVMTLHGGLYDVPEQEATSWTEPARGAIEWGKVLGLVVGSRRVVDDAAAVVCLGPEEARLVAARHPHARIELIPNGVDIERFSSGDGDGFRRRLGLAADASVAIVVGRIDPQKGQDLAVRALARVAESDPSARLVLIGPTTAPAYRDEVVLEASRLGVLGRVTLVDGLAPPEVADAYHGADVLLLPSRHEPFGMAILEAWVAGLPVVAARVGGVPGFASDGHDALLFEPGDPDGLASRWRAVILDARLRRSLAAAGRRKARSSYGWDTVTDRLAALYDDLVRREGRRRAV